MAAIPDFPLLPDGTLPPLALLLRWLEQAHATGATAVRLGRLPPGNGTLPDLLRLGGIARVVLARPLPLACFRWEGCGGARVVVGDAEAEAAALPLHHGHLPVDPDDDEGADATAIAALVDLARLEDANALCDQGAGASWDHILAAAGIGQPPRIPPLAAHHLETDGRLLGAWNPLPFARQLVVALPLPKGTPPWAITDERGARHPVQVVEGPRGRELLTCLRLEALQCARFAPHHDPVAGSHWEISRTVLDNGRVRAELDPLGQVVRLCWNGRFASLSGPALHPLLDGLPLAGAATTTVLEEGPVRARVAVSRLSTHGALHLVYTLHAHEDMLRVSASWDGENELILDHPTTHRGGLLRAGGELAGWCQGQAADALGTAPTVQRGVRWATLGEDGGQGVALAAGRPLPVSAHAGHLRVHLERSAAYVLAAVEDGHPLTNLAHASLALAVPGRAFAGSHSLPGSFRLQAADHLACWWARRPAEWMGELTLAETSGRRTRATLFPTAPGAGSAGEAWRVDASGQPLDPLPATPEADGFELEIAPHDVLIVRWR